MTKETWEILMTEVLVIAAKENQILYHPCRNPRRIFPQIAWENLNQMQLLSWVQVLSESYLQSCSLAETIERWERSLNFDIQTRLQVDTKLLNLEAVELTSREVLEIMTWLILRVNSSVQMTSGIERKLTQIRELIQTQPPDEENAPES